MKGTRKKWEQRFSSVSLSATMTAVVVMIVLLASMIAVSVFLGIYRSSMEQSAVTSSEQAVVQVQNTVTDYTEDMSEIMEMIRVNMEKAEVDSNVFFTNLMEIRTDVVAVASYDTNGNMLRCWSGSNKLKERIIRNLSYMKIPGGREMLHLSSPHVESLFDNYYPWVVTIAQNMVNNEGEEVQICMDIRFSNIANYVDEVGIGQHGYCFIMDGEGNIIYHPQQQLIYAGLKSEKTEQIKSWRDGSTQQENVIYTIHTLSNCDWRIVGVSYVDELITSKVQNMVHIVLLLLLIVLVTASAAGLVFSKLVSKPVSKLAWAMSEFEKDAANFEYRQIYGTSEIAALSDSFGHMVVQIQGLMDKVREEEVTLRKTELNALQAQINPHFLYNTLDSIAWMCEEERTGEAVVMVNALAKLFRISISKGHELITIEKECEHAKSYLKIQKFRYKNQFSYQFDVEEGCLPYLCNKITLQPIIENAIYHGLDLSDEGIILIGIHESDGDIILSVEDNGVGMTEEQCKEILHTETSDKTGIGIKNVNDRIKIYFGEKYGLTITSELDEGTRVEIRMPKVLEGDYGTK